MPGDSIEELYAPVALSGMVFESAPLMRHAPRASEETQKQEEEPVKLSLSPAARDMLSKLGEGEPPVPDSKSSAGNPDESKDEAQGQGDAKEETDWRQRREADLASSGAKTSSSGSGSKASSADKAQLDELRQRDADVRTHEQQHMAAAGGYVKGGPVYDYQAGPDGRMYAVGGHVELDTSSVPGDPEATIQKARVLQQAANAVAEPSSADRAVASGAAAMEREAEAELSKKASQGGEDSLSGGAKSVSAGAGAAASQYAKASQLGKGLAG